MINDKETPDLKGPAFFPYSHYSYCNRFIDKKSRKRNFRGGFEKPRFFIVR